jgi:hypothetical protein
LYYNDNRTIKFNQTKELTKRLFGKNMEQKYIVITTMVFGENKKVSLVNVLVVFCGKLEGNENENQ